MHHKTYDRKVFFACAGGFMAFGDPKVYGFKSIFDDLVSSGASLCKFCYLPELFVEIISDYLRIITDLQCLASKPWK